MYGKSCDVRQKLSDARQKLLKIDHLLIKKLIKIDKFRQKSWPPPRKIDSDHCILLVFFDIPHKIDPQLHPDLHVKVIKI